MKERILFVGVGQCGGNICQLLHKKGYFTHFINASNDDIQSLDVKEELKFPIPNTFGCNKDRQKALGIAKEYYQYISSGIEARYPKQDIVIFVFSLSGGLGSGLAPVMIDYLSKKNPKKHYCSVVVFPSNSESIMAHRNTIEAYQQLNLIHRLNSIFALDNNGNNKFYVNSEFVDLFDTFVNMSKPDHRGVVDEAELENILTCKGNVYMGYVDMPSKNTKNETLIENKIFVPFQRGCQYIAVSLTEEYSPVCYEDCLGTPIDTYVGYTPSKPFIIASGMKILSKKIEELVALVKERQNMRDTTPDVQHIELPELQIQKPHNEEKEEKLDFNEIFGKFIG